MPKEKKTSSVVMYNLRAKMNFSQSEFAEFLGVTRSYVSQLENNLDISLSKFIDICNKCGIEDVNELINKKTDF